MAITVTGTIIKTDYRRVPNKSFCLWWYQVFDDWDDKLIDERGPYNNQREAFEAGSMASQMAMAAGLTHHSAW